MTQKTVKIPVEHMCRIEVALHDSLGELDVWFSDHLEDVSKWSDKSKDGHVELGPQQIKILCKMFAIELNHYANVLHNFGTGNIASYTVILDYIEEMSCICECLQYLMENHQFQRHFFYAQDALMRKKLALIEEDDACQ